MAAEAAVRGSVGTSRRVLDEAYETGTAILGSMAGQRDTLKVHSTCCAHVAVDLPLQVPWPAATLLRSVQSTAPYGTIAPASRREAMLL